MSGLVDNCAGKSSKGVAFVRITGLAGKSGAGHFSWVSGPFVSDSRITKNLPLFHAHIPPMSFFLAVPTPIHTYRHFYFHYFALVRVCVLTENLPV